jgi:hypothetical protein
MEQTPVFLSTCSNETLHEAPTAQDEPKDDDYSEAQNDDNSHYDDAYHDVLL